MSKFLHDAIVSGEPVKLSNKYGEACIRIHNVHLDMQSDSVAVYEIEATDYPFFSSKKMNIPKVKALPDIKNVIYNDPATIVFWSDGTKTVVKCGEGDDYDPEKGLAMAISKKALGNQGNYYNTFTKWLSEEEDVMDNILSGLSQLAEIFRRFNTGGDK